MTDQIRQSNTQKKPNTIRYVLSKDRADCLLRTIIESADEDELTIRIKKDWRGNIIFYLPVSSEYYKEEGLHCVIRREEIEIDKDGVKQTISKHDKDLVELKGHEVLELSDVGDYATGIFLPRKVSEEENENI